jgi:hypothetical protein
MLELIVGIVLGATFADFWKYLYQVARKRIAIYMRENKTVERE